MEAHLAMSWSDLVGLTEEWLGLSWERLTGFGWAYVACTLIALGVGLWRLRRGDATAAATVAPRVHAPGTPPAWVTAMLGVLVFAWLMSYLFANPRWLTDAVRWVLGLCGVDNRGSFSNEIRALQYCSGLAAQLLSVAGLLLLGRALPGLLHTRPDADNQERLWLNGRGLARLGGLFATCLALLTLGSLTWGLFSSIAESQGQPLPRDIQPLVEEIARWHGPSWLLSVLLVSATIGAPIFEEIGFRAILYPALRETLPRGWAIAATGLFFGLLHGNLAAFIPISLMGAWLCIVRDRHGIGTCILVHALNNAWTAFWLITAPEVAGKL